LVIRIETPGLIIEEQAHGSFSMSEVQSGLEVSIALDVVPQSIRPIAPSGQAEELANELHSDSKSDALPPQLPERMAALREAFNGPLDVSVRWLKRFRTTDSPLSSGERRALRVLERLVATEIELARSSVFR
jgi:hypothetical protein